MAALYRIVNTNVGHCAGGRKAKWRFFETGRRLWSASRPWLRLPYQNHVPSRQGCGVEVGLPSLYSHRLSRRTGIGAIGSNSSNKDVLARRQIAIIALALAKAGHVNSAIEFFPAGRTSDNAPGLVFCGCIKFRRGRCHEFL